MIPDIAYTIAIHALPTIATLALIGMAVWWKRTVAHVKISLDEEVSMTAYQLGIDLNNEE